MHPTACWCVAAGARVLWSADVAETQLVLTRQYVLRGDRCGCSQQQNVADRALATEAGVNKLFDGFEVVPSRWAQDKFRVGYDLIAPHVAVARSTYGREAACLPFHVWFDFWAADAERAARQVCNASHPSQRAHTHTHTHLHTA